MSRCFLLEKITVKAAALLICALLLFNISDAQSETEERPDSDEMENAVTDSVKTSSESLARGNDTIEMPVLRTISDSDMRAVHADPKYAYANDPAYWRKRSVRQTRPPSFRGLRYIIYFLFISGVIVVLVRTWQDNGFGLISFSRRSRKTREQLETIIALDLDEEIRVSTRRQDWASAVRFMYLKMLSMAQDKFPSNPDTIFSEQPKSASFRYLRRAYEYVYYGAFSLSKAQFDQLQPRFTEAYQTLSS